MSKDIFLSLQLFQGVAMQIALIEPFFSGSHRSWAEELQKQSCHDITLFTLPGIFWKWRLSNGASLLAEQFLKSEKDFDLLLTTSMLDLPTFLGYTRKKSSSLPVVHYFHENQLTYPWSTQDTETKRGADQHYILKNINSALTADCALFNSEYNRSSFLHSIPDFYRRFPDFNQVDISAIANKSSVLPVGLELDRIQKGGSKKNNKPPLILWNHRWEYDKGADVFFRVLYRLSEEQLAFRLAVIGEPPLNPKSEPFLTASQKLHHHIEHWGFLEKKSDYYRVLEEASILPVTNRQEFFGISVMEAVYAGAIPLLPERLTYPDLFQIEQNSEYFYRTEEQLYLKLKEILRGEYPLSPLSSIPEKYAWPTLITQYDEFFTSLLS